MAKKLSAKQMRRISRSASRAARSCQAAAERGHCRLPWLAADLAFLWGAEARRFGAKARG